MTDPAGPFTEADHLAAARLITFCGNDEVGSEAASIVALVAVVRRLDAFAAALAGVAEDMKAASGGGLLGLLTGRRGQ